MSDMSVNSSSNSSFHFENCLNIRGSIFTAVLITHILLVPLFVFVLYVGYQHRTKRRSVSMAAMASHSDILTFNMVALELINALGSCFFYFGSYINHLGMILVAYYIFSIIVPGQSLFHLLACVERYVAVVHPITYLGLRQATVVRIRNITIGCVWLICFASIGLTKVIIVNFSAISNIVLMIFSAIIVCFCSLSVVCVLIRPGPGNKERVDPLKQRAFYTVVVLMGTLLLKFLSHVVCTALLASSMFLHIDSCLAWSFAIWFSLPGSLVLPLLFLHRAGKLPGCK